MVRARASASVASRDARSGSPAWAAALANSASACAWSSGPGMVRARASARSGSPAWAAGHLGERLRLPGRAGDGAGQGLGAGDQLGRAVRVAGLGGCAGQPGEHMRLGVRVGDGAGQGLGLGGQPGRAVRVAGLGGCAGQPGECPRPVVRAGDGAGQGLGMGPVDDPVRNSRGAPRPAVLVRPLCRARLQAFRCC